MGEVDKLEFYNPKHRMKLQYGDAICIELYEVDGSNYYLAKNYQNLHIIGMCTEEGEFYGEGESGVDEDW